MADLITAKQLREERAPLAHQMKALNDKVQAEKRDFNAEEKQQWENLNLDYDLFSARIATAERVENVLAEQLAPVDAKNGTSVPGREDYNGREALERFENAGAPPREVVTDAEHALALQAWAIVQSEQDIKLSDSHQRACRLTGVNPHNKNFHTKFSNSGSYNEVRRNYRNALSGNDGTKGAFTRPEGFVANLETALLAYSKMREVAEVMRTTDGNPLPWPTVDNTSNTGYIVGENQSNTTEQQPTFGRVVWSAYQYTSGFIKIPNSFFTDSAFDLAAIVGSMQGEMIGRRQATDFTTGDGVNKATGFVRSCVQNSATVAAGSATGLLGDDFLNLKHGIDPAYRELGCTFMLHDSILLAARKLKDGNGMYLWQSGLALNQPDSILGDPVYINQAMDSTMSAGKYSVAYGLFSKYKIRDVNDIVMRRADERYIENDQTGFIAFLRSDGNLLDAGRRPIKLLSH